MNRNVAIALLVIVVLLAIFSGFWAIEAAIKIALYVALALLAIWAIMVLVRGAKDASHGHGSRV